MRAVARTAALFIITLCAASAFAQVKETSETIKLTGDLRHYHGMVAGYRQGNDDVVTELLTWDEPRIDKAVGAINSRLDPNTPWSDDFLRSGALLQTAAGLRTADEGHIDRMKFHFDLAARQLRLGSADLGPFAGRWYYAAARLYRGYAPLTGFSDAEALLEGARRHIPSNPLVLYESAVLAEIRATEWQTAPLKWRPYSGTSFREMAALGDIVQGRAVRLQKARDWLRQSVSAAPTALSRLHYGRVLMMQKEDEQALAQLAAVQKATTDRATQYLAILFSAAIHERRGRLDLAAGAYQRAIECFPESDAAYIGLSEVLQTAGQGDQARAILREFLRGRERHEPWTWYFLEPNAVARERVAALFEEGRR